MSKSGKKDLEARSCTELYGAPMEYRFPSKLWLQLQL